MDLTDSGSSDRILIETDAVPAGAAIVLVLEDPNGRSSTIGPPFSGSGSGAGSWQIRDVRTTGPALPVPDAIVLAGLLTGTGFALPRVLRSSRGFPRIR